MLKKPDISIVVCDHTNDFIHKFVESVKRSVGLTYEIIIITSHEGLATTGIKGCNVQYHTGMPAAKRNAGVRLSRGEYIAFFDDDVEIEPECLSYLLQVVKEPSVGMVYGKLLKADEPHRFDEAGGFLTSSGFIWSRAGQNIIDEGQFDTIEPIFAGKSASCIIRKDVFKKVGGFDEDFEILGEESDLSWRVWLLGYKVMFTPYARGIHYFNTKFKPQQKYYTSKRVQFNGTRNYCTMLIKNLETINLWKILPIHVMIWFFAGCAMLITGKARQGMNIFHGLIYVLTHLTMILRKRSIIQERRNISDERLFKTILQNAPRGYYISRLRRYISIGLHG